MTLRTARRTARAAAALVSAVLVLGACASTSHPQAAAHRSARPAATAVKTFVAYDRQGRLLVPAGAPVAGRCWTASIAAPSAGAYRCFSGNKILDPCLRPPTGGTSPATVACVTAPWSRAVVLRLSQPLPAAAPVSERGRPWALRLDNGVRCLASTGVVPSVAGVNLPYHCTGGTDAVIVDANARVVQVRYGLPSGHTLTRRSVAMMWRS